MKRVIRVTKKDILQSERLRKRVALFEGPTSCPIAIACRRSFKASLIYVDGFGEVNVDGRKGTVPPVARRFINRFDNKAPVRPIRFVLSVR